MFNLNMSWRPIQGGWVVSAMSQLLHPQEREPVLTVHEAGWAPGMVWTSKMFRAPINPITKKHLPGHDIMSIKRRHLPLSWHTQHNVQPNYWRYIFWCLHSCGVPNTTTCQIICLYTCNNLGTAKLIFMKIHLLQKMSCHFYCHLNQTILIITL